MAVAKVRTVLLAENCTSREPLCFPMTIASVLFRSALRVLVVDHRLTPYGELVIGRVPVIIEESMKVYDFARVSVLCPN